MLRLLLFLPLLSVAGCAGGIGAVATPPGASSDSLGECLAQRTFSYRPESWRRLAPQGSPASLDALLVRAPGAVTLSLARDLPAGARLDRRLPPLLVAGDMLGAGFGPADAPVAAAGRDLARPNWPNLLDIYLDCALWPVDPGDRDARQLRAHILLTLMAGFGRLQATDQGEAAALLGRIETAAVLITAASLPRVQALHREAGAGAPPLRLPPLVEAADPLSPSRRLDRALALGMVAVEVSRAEGRNVLEAGTGIVGTAAGAIAGGVLAPTQLLAIGRAVGELALNAQRVRLTGAAGRQSAAASLASCGGVLLPGAAPGASAEPVPPGPGCRGEAYAALWEIWAGQLGRECDRLAELAGRPGHACVPGYAQVLPAIGAAVPGFQPPASPAPVPVQLPPPTEATPGVVLPPSVIPPPVATPLAQGDATRALRAALAHPDTARRTANRQAIQALRDAAGVPQEVPMNAFLNDPAWAPQREVVATRFAEGQR